MKEETPWPALDPIDFFDVEISFRRIDASMWRRMVADKKMRLPDLAELTGNKIALFGGWAEEGLFLRVEVGEPMHVARFPEIREGDSLELFVDTRCIKEGRFLHRFCHHFYVLPEAVDGAAAGEITRFRGDDRHPLAKQEEIEAHFSMTARRAIFEIALSKDALFGYDPGHVKKIGFSLRINRHGKEPLHYHMNSNEFEVEEEPALWTTVELKEDGT